MTKALTILIFIFVIGAIIRIHALSVYKFYPDSYVPLAVAENIATYHRAVAPLGPNGMLYPDYFAWTRPLYPLFIDIGSLGARAEVYLIFVKKQ